MKSISERNENCYRAGSKRTCQFITQTKAAALFIFYKFVHVILSQISCLHCCWKRFPSTKPGNK